MDYDRIIENVRELNLSVGESEAHVTRDGNGARLTRKQAVPLQLYANGILMFGGPFRPFSDPGTRLCVKDLQDGYFPSEMQKDYPDGIVFDVQDKRSCRYIDERERRLADELSPLQTNESLVQVSSADANAVRRERAQHFLNRLPPVVVSKDGKIVDIREGVAEHLRPAASASGVKEVLVDTKSAVKNQQGESTTLRIKSESGAEVYVLKLLSSNTIADVRACLDKHR